MTAGGVRRGWLRRKPVCGELPICVESVIRHTHVEHTAQVTAQSLYEAVAQALRVFREDEWSEGPNRGPASVVVTRLRKLARIGREESRRDGVKEPIAGHHRTLRRQHIRPLLANAPCSLARAPPDPLLH
jgi:hypothetical protein